MLLFNKHAGTKFDVKLASLDALDAARSKSARVCPLVCLRGYHAEGEECVRSAKKPAKDDTPSSAPKSVEAPKPPKPQASGEIICTQGGCRPVKPGCHVGTPFNAGTGGGVNTMDSRVIEVCH